VLMRTPAPYNSNLKRTKPRKNMPSDMTIPRTTYRQFSAGTRRYSHLRRPLATRYHSSPATTASLMIMITVFISRDDLRMGTFISPAGFLMKKAVTIYSRVLSFSRARLLIKPADPVCPRLSRAPTRDSSRSGCPLSASTARTAASRVFISFFWRVCRTIRFCQPTTRSGSQATASSNASRAFSSRLSMYRALPRLTRLSAREGFRRTASSKCAAACRNRLAAKHAVPVL